MAKESVKKETVKVKLLTDTAHEHPDGGHVDARKGAVIETTPQSAARLIELGKAELPPNS